MAANLSDNLKITKAPPVGAFALRRYDRGIREGLLHQYPCHIAELTRHIRRKKNFKRPVLQAMVYPLC